MLKSAVVSQTTGTCVQVMVDFHACRWPPSIPTSHDTSIAEYFDNLNEPALSNLAENLEMEEEENGTRSPLITFSHFLPLQVRTLFVDVSFMLSNRCPCLLHSIVFHTTMLQVIFCIL